jgi:peptide/nickel transport system permease protein
VRRYLAGRLVQSLVVVLMVTTASFFLAHLAPGGPFSIDDPRMTEEVRQHLRSQFGLDRPLLEQFGRYLLSLAQGELGHSFSRQMPVGRVIAAALPRTLLLMGVALTLSIGIGVAIGVYQAARRGRRAARILSAVSLFFYSLPEFWLGVMVLILFAYWIPLFPPGGIVDPSIYEYLGFWGRLRDRLHHLALPALTFTLLTTAVVSSISCGRRAQRDCPSATCSAVMRCATRCCR